MNSPNFDNSGDFESWDGKGELEWTEKNWKQFLKDADVEVGKFVKIYQSLKGDETRLDHTALGMGWDSEEWSADLDYEEDDKSGWLEDSLDEEDEEFDEMDDNDPYTVHKHPLFVTSKALYMLVNHYWKYLHSNHKGLLGVEDVIRFGEEVQNGEVNAVMGIHALEMGDYHLVVCHLQRAMAHLNESMSLFTQATEQGKDQIGKELINEFQSCFFDLREVWLRVIRECRGSFDFRG